MWMRRKQCNTRKSKLALYVILNMVYSLPVVKDVFQTNEGLTNQLLIVRDFALKRPAHSGSGISTARALTHLEGCS